MTTMRPIKNFMGIAMNSTVEYTLGDPSPKFSVVERSYFPKKNPDINKEASLSQ